MSVTLEDGVLRIGLREWFQSNFPVIFTLDTNFFSIMIKTGLYKIIITRWQKGGGGNVPKTLNRE